MGRQEVVESISKTGEMEMEKREVQDLETLFAEVKAISLRK
jgi:hypothetical protein